MQLNWVNPWRFLAFRLFSWFWLVLLLTIAAAWLLAKAFLDDTVIRRLPPGVHEHAERMLHSLQRFDSVEDLLQRLNRRENNRWLLVDPVSQQILNAHILPRGFDQSWLTELSQFEKPRLFLHRHISLAGPFFVRLNGQPLVLYQQQPRPDRPGMLGLAQLPELTIPLLFLLVSALASIGLALTITRPLRQLQQQSLQFAGGDLTSRVQQAAARSDEIGELARGFNTMASQIGALLQNQQRLLRDISHELRSPLTRAQLAIALEQRQGGGGQLPRLSQELDKIDSMLDELLTFSRLDAGQYQLQLQDLDLTELLEEIIQVNQLEASQKRQQIQLEAPPQCWLQADSRLLARAVENVLRNAIKYSPAGSVIRLQLQADAGQLQLCVCDQGPGIPDSALQAIFEPFYRVSDARTAGAGGTGLGLAIAAQAMKQHQGQISAQNIYQADQVRGLQICLQMPAQQELNL
ncbi:ATP-binding protein [Rheinheimera sp.]|uniref:ATP-binding protein n=1 Tax=Rheinheimera sp. TaxID=1869214 RepID=UPI003D27E10A